MTRIIIADISELSEKNFETINQLIDPSRRNIADSYNFEQDRKLSVMSEFCLYYLVSLEYQYDSDLFIKGYSSNGKPYFLNNPEVFFSVSHSGTKCIVGISKEHEIGVDIECLLRYKDSNLTKDIINIFDEDELSLIELGEDYLERALVLWTKKEALLKSLGTGTLRQILHRKLTKEELERIRSFIFDNYAVSIVNSPQDISILYTKNIGIEKIIEHIEAWKIERMS